MWRTKAREINVNWNSVKEKVRKENVGENITIKEENIRKVQINVDGGNFTNDERKEKRIREAKK